MSNVVLMTIIICITLSTIFLIASICRTIEKCNQQKWKSKSPKKFEDPEIHSIESRDLKIPEFMRVNNK